MAEFRRAAIRIISNYVRLAFTFVLGFYLVRALLGTLGEEGSGLVSLLGSTVGIVAMVEEAASWSMIRELGAAHHSSDRSEFRRVFHSAVLVCLIAAGLMLVAFGVLFALLPLLDIGENLLPAARWFVIAKAVEAAVLVMLAPQFNMYLVTERMVAYNFWLTIRRATAVLGVLAVMWMNPSGDTANGLIIFGWASTIFLVLAIAVSAIIITIQDRRLLPGISRANKAGVRSIFAISGYNIAIQSSQTLAFPTGAIIMNKGFGLIAGNLTYGVGYTLSGYARQLASGMTMGLDAVAARISADLTTNKMPLLVRYSTMLHGLAVFPAVFCIGVLAHPILELWIGPKLNADTASETLAITTSLTRIMLISMGIICLCDCWTRILFGAGFVRKYAPALILGNICTPFVALLFYLILPPSHRYAAVVWAIALIYVVVYLGWVPRQTAKAFSMKYREILSPLLRPLIAAAVCSPVLLLFLMNVPQWTLWWLAAAGSSYGTAYLVVAWLFVVPAYDRTRITDVLRVKLMRRKPA